MATTTIYPTGVAGTSGTRAVGTITCPVKASLADGETITLTDALGVIKVFEFDTNGTVGTGNIKINIASATTADEVAQALKLAIVGAYEYDIQRPLLDQGLSSHLYVGALRAGAVLTVTQRKPGVAGNVAITTTSGAVTKTDFSGGVDPTGDMQVLQVAIDAASDGDVIIMNDKNISEVATAWKFAGNFVEDFDVPAKRNGTLVGGTYPLSHTGGTYNLFTRGAGLFGASSAKRGRAINVGKAITIKGNGVTAGVPNTKIESDAVVDFSGFATAYDALTLTQRRSAPTRNPILLSRVTKFHAFALHSKKARLEDLHFNSAEVHIVVAHPFEVVGVHSTNLIHASFIEGFVDLRTTYPNWTDTNPDLSNPVTSLVSNCKATNCRRFLDGFHNAVTVANNEIVAFAPDEGVINLLASRTWIAQNRDGRANQKLGVVSNNVIRNNTFSVTGMAYVTNLEGAINFGASISFPDSGELCDDNTVRDNVFLDMASSSGVISHRAAIHYRMGPYSLCNRNQLINNTINKAGAGILFESIGSTSDLVISDNTFVNTRLADATHLASSYLGYNQEIVLDAWWNFPGNSMSAPALIGNDYKDSGALGRSAAGDVGSVLLLWNCDHSLVQDNGGYPQGLGGATNFVTLVDSVLSRIVGFSAAELVALGGNPSVSRTSEINEIERLYSVLEE